MTIGASHAKSRVITDGQLLRELVQTAQRNGDTVGLVPTMGALHEGHMSLVDAARADCDLTVATIFVNPTQFAPHEDFNKYPRPLERDLEMLSARGCDVIFTPSVAEMYPPGNTTYVDVGPLGQVLEGEFRPTHFRGVATVVLKLFQLAPADRAYFGRKDYQQTLVVRQMVEDLNVPVAVRVGPIVREADGLAMSSRNAYLSPDERRRALALSQSLRLAEQLAAGGERKVAVIERRMRELIDSSGGAELQYIAFLMDGTVTPVATISGPTAVVLAAFVGKTRLIDNTQLGTGG
ncbi:MAG: pantoate--beta-alanine ligase [Pirellulales bacterium]